MRKIDKVRCYSPNAERRTAFAREMQERTGTSVVACDSPQEAVKGAEIVLCATNSWSPVFLADWIEKGVHLSTVQHAELDPGVFKAADVLVGHYSGRPAVIDVSLELRERECLLDPKAAVHLARPGSSLCPMWMAFSWQQGISS